MKASPPARITVDSGLGIHDMHPVSGPKMTFLDPMDLEFDDDDDLSTTIGTRHSQPMI
jgi:hypothetical protein